jgi:type IV fimbrial biogenesis protein FimT
MVVVIIIGIFLLVAAPSYTTLIERTRLKSYANELVTSVYLARSEAIKRNQTTTLCVSSDGTACTGGGDWEQGWIVVDTSGTVIKHQQSLPSGMVLFELSSVNFSALQFQPSGIVSTSASMKICQQTPSVGVEEKIVSFTATGRPRIQTTSSGCP